MQSRILKRDRHIIVVAEQARARAVPRLQIIGSPRGAAEKFDAKRVIGAAFF